MKIHGGIDVRKKIQQLLHLQCNGIKNIITKKILLKKIGKYRISEWWIVWKKINRKKL